MKKLKFNGCYISLNQSLKPPQSKSEVNGFIKSVQIF